MDRLDEMRRSLNEFRSMWIRQKIEICRKQQLSDLLERTEQVLLNLKKEQDDGRGQNFCYLALFHFRSSVWTGTNRYQICATDETLYLNSPLASEYWIPKVIYNDKAELRSALEKELKKDFIRLLPFEVDSAVKIVLEDYQKLVEVYWKQVTEEAVIKTILQSLQKHSNWRILSGIYMDEMKVIL